MSTLEESVATDNLKIDFDPSLKPNSSYYKKNPGCEMAVVYLPTKDWKKVPAYKDLVALADAKHRLYKLNSQDIHIQETLDHPDFFANEDLVLLKNAAAFLIPADKYKQAAATEKFVTFDEIASYFGCTNEMVAVRFSCGDGDMLLRGSRA